MKINYGSSDFTLKQKETLVNQVLRPLMQQAIKDNKGMMSYPGVITKIYDDSSNVDVSVSCGNTTTVLDKIPNKTNTIFNLNDACEVIAPHSDLTNCYVGVNYSDVLSIAAENIIGTLSFGNRKNQDGQILMYDSKYNQIALRIANYLISFYDFLSTNQKIGDLGAYRLTNSEGVADGTPITQLTAEKGTLLALSCRNDDGVSSSIGVEISNNVYNDGKYTYIKTPLTISNYTGISVDSHTALYIQKSGNQIYGDMNCEGYNWSNFNSITTNSLTVNGSKSCSVKTEDFGNLLMFCQESTGNWFTHEGFGKIKDGKSIIMIEPKVYEIINTDIKYIFKFIPDESCEYKIEKHPTYVLITANKDIEFSYELKGKRRGFENKKLNKTNGLDKSFIHSNKNELIKQKKQNKELQMKSLLSNKNKEEL